MGREQKAHRSVDAIKNAAREGLKITDIRYDTAQGCWWDIVLGYPHKEVRAVNALMHHRDWPAIEVKDDAGEIKEKIFSPADWTSNAEKDLTVDNTIWWPGMPIIIDNYITAQGGYIIPMSGKRMYNLYKAPPRAAALSGRDLGIWLEHLQYLWPNDFEYLLDYCAHLIQRPEEKCNVFIIMSGGQGIGKDVALKPVRKAIGEYNTKDIGPDALVANFNPWKQCLMLIVNEMTSEEVRASTVYESIKSITATPPDMFVLRDKHMKDRYIMNVLRAFVTTNHMHSLYIDADDRRSYVMHSPATKREPAYYRKYHDWLENQDGYEIVAAFLAERDISKFDPKDAPPMTSGKSAILSGWAPGDDGITEALDALGRPPVFFSVELNRAPQGEQFDSNGGILSLIKNHRRLIHRMRAEGYFSNRHNPPIEFVGKKRVKYRMSFFQEKLIGNLPEITRLTFTRGQMLADDITQIGSAMQHAKGF